MVFHKFSRGKGVDVNQRKMFRKNSHAINSNTVGNSLENSRESSDNSKASNEKIYLKFDRLDYHQIKTNGRYEIFVQKDIKINRLANQKITLLFGIHIESGIALVTLRESIKSKLDYYDHDMIISESTLLLPWKFTTTV